MIKKVEKILKTLIKYRFFVLSLTLLFTLFMGWQASQVKIQADADSLLPDRDELIREFQAKGIPQNDYLVVGVERDNLFDLDFLKILDKAVHDMGLELGVESIMSPFNQAAFEKKGAFFTIVNTTDSGKAPENEEELQLFRERITSGDLTNGLFISTDETMFLILLEYGEVTDYTQFMGRIEKCLEPLKSVSRLYISGNPPFEVSAVKYLLRDISIFLSLGIVLILIVYYFGFSSKKSIFLPIIVIICGTIWTVGLMSLLGFAISIVSIVVPPLVLTLGSSYTIHILNSYFRLAPENSEEKQWITVPYLP